MTDYTRDDLIAIAARAVVPVKHWYDRDSPRTQEQVGKAWALLRSGADFEVLHDDPHGLTTDDSTIWLQITWPSFDTFELGDQEGEPNSEHFYLPTPGRLDRTVGRDWY